MGRPKLNLTPESLLLKKHKRLARRSARSRERYKEDPAYRAKSLAKNATYQVANPEKIKEGHRRWEANNKEAYAAKKKQYREKNRDRLLANSRVRQAAYRQTPEFKAKRAAYVAANHEMLKEGLRSWYQANKAKVLEKAKQYYRDHPEKVIANVRKGRARRLNAEGSHTAQDIHDLHARQGEKCATCKTKITKNGSTKYHVDHVIPLILGGTNYIENICLQCATCNLRKNATHPDDWAKRHGLLFI